MSKKTTRNLFVQIPEELYWQVKADALENRRSLQEEVAAALEFTRIHSQARISPC